MLRSGFLSTQTDFYDQCEARLLGSLEDLALVKAEPFPEVLRALDLPSYPEVYE